MVKQGIGMMGSSFHTNHPQTEAEVFEQFPENPASETWETMVVGAIMTNRGLFHPSRAERTADELRIYGIIADIGAAIVITAHRGGQAIFADAISVVW
jgi:hypothetical protein